MEKEYLKNQKVERKINRREAIKNGLFGIAATATIGASIYGSITHIINRDILKQEDFNNATWIPYYNKNGRIWTPYMNEKIPHNLTNWELYQREVSKRNKANLEGDILLPDLDKSGKVGK